MVALVVFSFLQAPEWVVVSVVSTVLVLMTATIFGGKIETAFTSVATGLTSVVYCSLTLGFLVLIPRPWILVLFAIVWIGDSAAFYGGRTMGRHRLAPVISPKKTVEGAIAGVAGSVIAGTIGGSLVLGKPCMTMLGICVVTAVAGQIGDLAESSLKRSAGVKDSSSILPGHGGILDRLDSLFFATPIFYWLLKA
jgi:phosphatidate cytidylyltransferase